MSLGLFVASAASHAQGPPSPPAGAEAPAQGGAAAAGGRGAAAGRGGRGGGGGGAYPTHPQADPQIVAQGQTLYMANCATCHGADARGGTGGINLVRSQLVMDDDAGELIAPVIQNGRPDLGMPAFSNFTAAQITDLAGYLHKVGASYRTVVSAPTNIVVGNAQAGEAFFNGEGKCSTCHSVTGDLAGIGSRMEPKALQNAIVAGRGGGRGFGAAPEPATGAAANRTTTNVTVTTPAGKTYEGRLDHLDDFLVTLTTADGSDMTLDRKTPDDPKVVVHNPLQAHIDMLPKYTDDEIHNLTAYLVTIK